MMHSRRPVLSDAFLKMLKNTPIVSQCKPNYDKLCLFPAREGQMCDLGGVTYSSGESFKPSCKHQCVCMNGRIGCVPMCASNVPLPSPDCPYPRRIHIPGKCCEEWVCEQTPQDHHYQSVVAGKLVCRIVLTEQGKMRDTTNVITM